MTKRIVLAVVIAAAGIVAAAQSAQAQYSGVATAIYMAFCKTRMVTVFNAASGETWTQQRVVCSFPGSDGDD